MLFANQNQIKLLRLCQYLPNLIKNHAKLNYNRYMYNNDANNSIIFKN